METRETTIPSQRRFRREKSRPVPWPAGKYNRGRGGAGAMKEWLGSRVTGEIEGLKRLCSFKIHEFRLKDEEKQKQKPPQPDNGASGQRRKLNWSGEKFEKA